MSNGSRVPDNPLEPQPDAQPLQIGPVQAFPVIIPGGGSDIDGGGIVVQGSLPDGNSTPQGGNAGTPTGEPSLQADPVLPAINTMRGDAFPDSVISGNVGIGGFQISPDFHPGDAASSSQLSLPAPAQGIADALHPGDLQISADFSPGTADVAPQLSLPTVQSTGADALTQGVFHPGDFDIPGDSDG